MSVGIRGSQVHQSLTYFFFWHPEVITKNLNLQCDQHKFTMRRPMATNLCYFNFCTKYNNLENLNTSCQMGENLQFVAKMKC